MVYVGGTDGGEVAVDLQLRGGLGVGGDDEGAADLAVGSVLGNGESAFPGLKIVVNAFLLSRRSWHPGLAN